MRKIFFYVLVFTLLHEPVNALTLPQSTKEQILKDYKGTSDKKTEERERNLPKSLVATIKQKIIQETGARRIEKLSHESFKELVNPYPTYAQPTTSFPVLSHNQEISVAVANLPGNRLASLEKYVADNHDSSQKIDEETLRRLVVQYLQSIDLDKAVVATTATPQGFSVDIKHLHVEKIFITGEQEMFTREAQEILENIFSQNPLTRGDFEEVMIRLRELPAYNKCHINFVPLTNETNLGVLVKLVKNKVNVVHADVSNNLNKRMGPWNTRLSYTHSNTFVAHDNLTLFGGIARKAQQFSYGGFDYNRFWGVTDTRAGVALNISEINPGGDAELSNHNIDSRNISTYLIKPLITTVKERLFIMPKISFFENKNSYHNNQVKNNTYRTELQVLTRYVRRDEWSGTNIINLTYTQGLHMGQDKTSLSSDNNLSARAVNIDISRIHELTKEFKVIPAFEMQFANGRPGPAQNYSFGSNNTENAYKNSPINGQSGYKTCIRGVYRDMLYAYYAYGNIKDKSGKIHHKEGISATGFGITYPILKDITLDMEYAIPLKRKTLNDTHKKKLFVALKGKWSF
ncbi:MAG: hypothetical protein H6849_02720 [Alphaproteobacteria bacterium]|nr:MAG: hypothetical protein H6849_02720 [Alphaproteobacteria bacterium]